MDDSLRSLLEPVPDERVPQLRAQLARGASALSATLAIGTPVWVLSAIVAVGYDPKRASLQAGIFFVAFASIALAARSVAGRNHPEVTLFASCVVTLAGIAVAGWPAGDHVNPVTYTAVVFPLVVAAFAPWKPRWSVALFPVALGAFYWSESMSAVKLPPPVVAAVPLTALFVTAVAAVSNQVQRKLWARLEATHAQLIASERIYGLGQMTAGIAHELKTPVAAAQNGLHSANKLCDEFRDSIGADGVTPEDLRAIEVELRDSLRLIADATGRTSSFVQAIRVHTSGLNVLHSVDFDVRQCIDGALLLLAHRIKHSRVRVDVEVPRPVVARGDPSKFDQIVTNLVQNAMNACDEAERGTRVVIRASGANGYVDLEVEDDGPGVPEGLREKIFEPLFTTREAGTGLGLAIAKDLAEGAFGGHLSLVPTPVGARFVVRCGHGADAARPAWAPAGSPPR